MYDRQLVKQFKIQFFNFTEVHATGTSNPVPLAIRREYGRGGMEEMRGGERRD